jgi:hypothetical protein
MAPGRNSNITYFKFIRKAILGKPNTRRTFNQIGLPSPLVETLLTQTLGLRVYFIHAIGPLVQILLTQTVLLECILSKIASIITSEVGYAPLPACSHDILSGTEQFSMCWLMYRAFRCHFQTSL